MDYILLGDNIRNARKILSLTQEKLAEYCNISTVFVSLIESGARKPSLETIIKIAEVLQVRVDDLINESGENRISVFDELMMLVRNRSESDVRFVTNVAREVLKNIDKSGS